MKGFGSTYWCAYNNRLIASYKNYVGISLSVYMYCNIWCFKLKVYFPSSLREDSEIIYIQLLVLWTGLNLYISLLNKTRLMYGRRAKMTAYDRCGWCWWPSPCHQPLTVGRRDACRFCVPLLPLHCWSLLGLCIQGSSTKIQCKHYSST